MPNTLLLTPTRAGSSRCASTSACPSTLFPVFLRSWSGCPYFASTSCLKKAYTANPVQHNPSRTTKLYTRAYEQGNAGSSKDPLDDYVEVKVESVRSTNGASVVYLRVLDGKGLVLPVHIGEAESKSLLKEINKEKQIRPMTHDVMRNIIHAISYRVTRIRVTDIIANTYYARIHIAKVNRDGGLESPEVDVDARPSDAINLALRFGAPMYVSKKIAETAQQMPDPHPFTPTSETHAEIVRSVRDTLASFEDPTVMFQLQKELAVQEERFEDAQKLQEQIFNEMTHNQLLRLVVAMEAALSDGRYEEAARLRDDYKRLVASGQLHQSSAQERR